MKIKINAGLTKMTDTFFSQPNSNFFLWYFGSKLKQKDELFHLSELCCMVGLTKSYLYEEAKQRHIEIWFKVPEEVEVRTFLLRDVLMSNIKSDLDYLTVLSNDNFGSLGFDFTEGYVSVVAGNPMPMEYLLVSFQDLRWHAKEKFCVFMDGIRKEYFEYQQECYTDKNVIENFADLKGEYHRYNFTKNKTIYPQVFITCNMNALGANEVTASDGVTTLDYVITLDEHRVERFSLDDMELYVQKTKLLELGYFKKITLEMEEMKEYMLKYLELEHIDFRLFPEKLFYIFVVTLRNLRRAQQEKKFRGIDRKNVLSELILFGIGNKLAQDICTLIVNTQTDSGGRKKFVITKDKNEKQNLSSLKVMELFKAFKLYILNEEYSNTSAIATYLTTKNFHDEVARRISPIITGTNEGESWAGFPLSSPQISKPIKS